MFSRLKAIPVVASRFSLIRRGQRIRPVQVHPRSPGVDLGESVTVSVGLISWVNRQ